MRILLDFCILPSDEWVMKRKNRENIPSTEQRWFLINGLSYAIYSSPDHCYFSFFLNDQSVLFIKI